MKNESLNDWTLERFILGDLSKREMDSIRRQLLSEPALRDRIRHLRRSDTKILSAYPVEKMVAEIENKLGREKKVSGENTFSRHRRFVRLAWVPAALGLLVGIYLMTSRISDHSMSIPSQKADSQVDRLKGAMNINIASAGLHIYRQDAEGIEELRDESIAAAHDLIQLAYTSGPFEYGMIFSIDGRGTVTLHFPDDPHQLPLLQKGKLVTLQKAYELDNAPSFERFLFIVSKNKINPSEILEKARQWAAQHPRQADAGSFATPPVEQISVLLRKR